MRKDKHMRDNTKYSSYWLRDDLFDDDSDVVDVVEKKQSNLLALASYKRAVSNFVNIVTNENIKVMFDQRGDNSYTDGKTVTISAKMDDKEFDPTVGLALHEGSHIKLTDFSSLDKLRNYDFPQPIGYSYLSDLEAKHYMSYDSVRSWVAGNIKDLLNVIEDRRIDYYIYSTSPGYKGYYHAMYDKYFNAKIIDKGLQSSEYRTEDWESYMFRIINITNSNRDLDALPMLRKVWELIDLKNINRLQNTQQAFELACEVFKLVEDSLPPSEQPENGDGNGEGNSDDTEQQPGEGTGGGGDNSETNGTDNTEGPESDGQSKQDSNGIDDTKGDAEGDDVKSGRSSYNPNGAGGDGSNNEIADNKVSSGEGELSDRQKKQLDNAIKKQKDFQNGDIKKKKVGKGENQKLDTLSKAGIDEKLAGKDYQSGRYWKQDKATSVVVVRNFTKGLIDSDTIDMLSTYHYYCDRNIPAITKGVQIGTMLGKRLKVRSEERSLVTPRMKNGKISGRLLHELGMGNVQIFDQTVVNKHKPALIHISIDASSSMGGKKWTNSQTAAVAIAKAASMTSNLDVVISYRSIQQGGGSHQSVQPLMLIAYDSRTDKFSKIQQLFQYINPCGTTPEGLCFESILDDITKTNKGAESYFINFSDGWPGFSNSDIEYGGDAAVNHTANQVKKMRMAGVNVLSYFIEEGRYGSAIENFRQMYGKSAEAIDVTSLIPLTRTLNKMFE
jgi:hypothetical protein